MLPSNFKKASNFHIKQIIDIEEKTYDNPWLENQFKKDIAKAEGLNYVCVNNDEVIGYLFGYLIQDEYQLNKITIKEEYRGMNVGKALFLHCFKYLKLKNVRCIQLEVSSLNLNAKKFYENLNFKYVGLRKDYYFRGNHGLLYNLDVK